MKSAIQYFLRVMGRAVNRLDSALQRAEYNLAVMFSPFAAGIVTEVGQAGPLSDGQTLHRESTVPGAIYGVPVQGPVTQPTNPSEAPASFALGQSAVVVYSTTQNPAAINAGLCAEQAFTVAGVQAGSIIFVNKPTTQVGLGMATGRVSAANTIQVTFYNPTAGNLTPTNPENYLVVEIRAPLVQTATLTPASVAANTTVEQVFTLTPAVGAFGLSSHQVGLTSGITALNQNPPGSNTLAAGAQPGSINRTLVTFGTPQTVIVNKPTSQAGLGIGNVRVAGNNQLGITFLNTTALAIVPTAAQVYSFFACRGISLNTPVVTYLAALAPVAVAQATCAEQAFATIVGIDVGDKIIGISKPTAQAGLGIVGWRVSAANTVAITYANVPAGGNITPTTEVNTIYVLKSEIGENAVLRQFNAVITPVAVATITGAEQTFTVTGLPALSPVMVNAAVAPAFAGNLGTALPNGLALGGCRTSALNTLAINFVNMSAAAILPGTLCITILAAQPDISGVTAGAAGSAVVWPVDVQESQQQESAEAVRQALVAQGAMAGLAGA